MERWLGGCTRPLLGLVAMIAFAAVGCDSPNTIEENDPVAQTETLGDPFGGYNTADEVAGFGDPFLLGDEGERAANDPVADEPDVQAAMDSQDRDLYAVRVTWGYHDRDIPDETERTTWDGSAMVDYGVLVALRTISFERRSGDGLIFPRPNRQMLEWNSTTTTRFDGVQLLIVDENEDVDNVFTLTLPQLTKTYMLSDLVELDEMIVVDDLGHQVHVQARKLDAVITPCHAGWMSGLWQPLPTDELGNVEEGVRGRFRGHWTDRRGNLGGYLRGHYGINARGHRVFFGKAVTMDGRFAGLLRGIWAPAPDTDGAGAFRGHWLNARRLVIGGLQGVYMTRDDGGVFHGAWATGCPEEDSPEEIAIDDSVF